MINIYNNYIIINLQMNNSNIDINDDNIINNIIIDVNNISEQKEEENILDVNNNAKNVLTFCNNCTFDVSCIYLLNLGKTINLRSSFNIDEKYNNNTMIMKYGCTKNLKTRLKQHIKIFEKINGVTMKIQKISLIDQSEIFKAETNVKKITTSYKFIYESYDELLIVNNKELKYIEDQYNVISELYGTSKELLIERYEKQLLSEQHEKQLLIEQHEKQLLIERHNVELERHKVELERHNVELERYKVESERHEKQILIEQHNKELTSLQQISNLEKQNLEQKIAYLTEKLNNLSKIN